MSPGMDRARDQEHLLDRMQRLRAILPAFAEELASARRQAASLRLENGRLVEQVRELQRQRATAAHTRVGEGNLAARPTVPHQAQ